MELLLRGETMLDSTESSLERLRGRLPHNSISKFLLAGHATITIRHAPTGERFTYKVSVPQNPDSGRPVHFVALLRGLENEVDYTFIGLIINGSKYKPSPKHISLEARAQKWFCRFFSLLTTGALPESVEVWHEGRCGRCGRKLTVPESIERGIGPECAEQMGMAF
jgi:hypothetical protein